MKDIILIGFGGHAKSVIDSIEGLGEYNIVGYTDVNELSDCCNYKYLGNDNVLYDYYTKGISKACICVGYMGKETIRDRLYDLAKGIGYELPVIADSSAIISSNVTIGEGTYIGKNVVINANSHIGKMCIINSKALIEHENYIGDFSHIAVGSVLCGCVRIGNHVLVGANATIIQERMIGNDVRIGAGAVVISDLPQKCTAVGNPAHVVKEMNQ